MIFQAKPLVTAESLLGPQPWLREAFSPKYPAPRPLEHSLGHVQTQIDNLALVFLFRDLLTGGWRRENCQTIFRHLHKDFLFEGMECLKVIFLYYGSVHSTPSPSPTPSLRTQVSEMAGDFSLGLPQQMSCTYTACKSYD